MDKTSKSWMLSLGISDKDEKPWRDTSKDIYGKYEGKQAQRASFNILWANTELLRPALYNSLPSPDIRRRFRDEDKIGKAVADVLNRCIEFCADYPSFDQAIKFDVLDALLCGRGLSRVRYVPKIRTYEAESPEEEREESEESGSYSEELEWEQCVLEHVQWDDFRRSVGKCWDEVEWVAFRHYMKESEVAEQFGKEKADQISYTDTKESKESGLSETNPLAKQYKVACVWEVWDKTDRKVYFFTESLEEPLNVVEDPLKLTGFFPIARPIYLFENSNSLVPVPLFTLYQKQAEELNKISVRITKLIDACKVRGIYDSRLAELDQLYRGDDNELIPAQNVAILAERGALNQFIWFAPLDEVMKTVQALYLQRDQCKQVIYELTGISDVLRGSSNPNETLGAQEIKAQYGSVRLQKMQREVQRYIRDTIRIMAEVISTKFQLETLQQMTMLPFATQEELMQEQMQYQMAAQQNPQLPPPESRITWEEVMQVLRNDTARTYKIDIETDSTIAATEQQDVQAITQLMGGIVEMINGFGPAVQSGAVPIELVKELIMSICRRAKMGSIVEDAIDKIQKPELPAPQDGQAQAQAAEQQKMQAEQAKQQQEMQMSQAKQQSEMQLAQMKLQNEQQLEQMRISADMQMKQMELAQQEKELLLKLQHEKELEAIRQSGIVNDNQ